MDALISLVYTIIDSVCVCLFLDAFASHRWRDHRFLVGVIVQTILMYASIEFNAAFLNRNQIIKILLILLSCFIAARALYKNITGKFLLFLIIIEYLLTYSCNGVQREHNKKLNNGLPILHKVPPKRDYGRYFCIMAEKGGTSHGGLD